MSEQTCLIMGNPVDNAPLFDAENASSNPYLECKDAQDHHYCPLWALIDSNPICLSIGMSLEHLQTAISSINKQRQEMGLAVLTGCTHDFRFANDQDMRTSGSVQALLNFYQRIKTAAIAELDMQFIGRSRRIPLLKRHVRSRAPLGLALRKFIQRIIKAVNETNIKIDPMAMLYLQCGAEYVIQKYFEFLALSARAGDRNKVKYMDSSMFKVYCNIKISRPATIDRIVNRYLTDTEKHELKEWEATLG